MKMDAVPGCQGAPRAVYQYFKGHSAQDSAKTDRGNLFNIY